MKNFLPVYGPVKSWRYGNSLGIDPIGMVSTCSFNCVYCQLGKIERSSLDRQNFVSTGEIVDLVKQKSTEKFDVITISGSGEPTLAINLGEIIRSVKQITKTPVIVLTNGSLLGLASVQSDLLLADEVSVKLDGITTDRVDRVNRPNFRWNWEQFADSFFHLRHLFRGRMTIQTMLLSRWNHNERQAYINGLNQIRPDRVYLNIPCRPKPKLRLLQGRENLTESKEANWFKPLEMDYLEAFAQEIRDQSGLAVSFVMVHEQ
ncbi:MAG: radical SAM protein [Cyanobacteria bacterium KgW148]|nr:radical SAM protein [Cyanobacteria bacterium KgW148]